MNVVPRPRLQDGEVILRAPTAGDADDRFAIGHDAEFVRQVGGDAEMMTPLTMEDATAWRDGVAGDPYTWVIDIGHGAVGTARLHRIDTTHRSAMFAIGIFDPTLWGQGYGSTATRLVVRFGFETLGLHRIALRVLTDNDRAIRAYERCGFVREGVLRDVEFVGGRWLSDLWMSILEDEYANRP